MMSSPSVKLYALSTCMWCRKTKALLDELGVAYECIYVNELQGDAREAVLVEMEKVNGSRSFPTIIIDDKVVIGFKPDEIKAALGK